MKDSLHREAWLTSAPTKKLMTALKADGAVVRFVGGCVRDSLRGIAELRELDLAIDAPPDEVSTLLEKAGIKPIPIGIEHGTVGCVIDGQAFEITTLRIDKQTDGRHAEIAFTKSWEEDAKRRDFTINAIYADEDGTIYDPLNGRADLEQSFVRFIGSPHERIEEDYLRILRFFRFFATLDKGEIDKQGLQACGEKKDGLTRLSKERIRDEFLRLLVAERAPEALRLMASAGILPFVLPHARGIGLFEKMHGLMTFNFIAPDPMRLLSAFYDSNADMTTDAKTLKLSNKQLERLEKVYADDGIVMKSYLSIREVHKFLYHLGIETFCDRIWVSWASDENLNSAVGWRALLAMAESWEKPQFPLTGQMVRAAGVPQGEAVGRIMREVESWWIDADFIEDEFSLIERLKAVVQATIYTRR